MSRRALVTGGSGYFGSLLVQKLLQRGYQCRVFDLNDTQDRPSEVEFIQGDVRGFDVLQKAFKDVAVVHHNVAQVPLAKNRALFNSVNIAGTENILRAALAHYVPKVVYTSSSAIFGVPRENPVTEETVPNPGEAYGRAKLEGETLCGRWKDKLDISIIRPRTILGHGRLGIFQILFEWIRQGANIPVLGHGDNLYQFVHADDLAEACIRAGERPGFSVYNCGAEKFGTMRETLEALCQFAGTGSNVQSVPMTPAVLGMKLTSLLGLSPLGPYHALMYGRSMYFDISKAKKELNWQPRYSNIEMFIESYKWYLCHRDQVLSARGASHHRSAVREGVLRLVRKFL
jgi:nucleoside-diphosphate-sugar epimerase